MTTFRLNACGLAVGAMLIASGAQAETSASATMQRSEALLGQEADARDAAARAALAESIVSQREAAMGRQLDAAYRAALTSDLAAQPLANLEALAGDRSIGLNAIGDTAADLVFTPVTPCRVIDTRLGGGPIAANTQRNFVIAGTSGFTAQGGSPMGCGIPLGPATSVVINFVAVFPAGAGNLRAWAVASPQPAAPLAAVLNYGVVAGLPALANGIVVPICNTAVTSCAAGDLRLQADSSATDVVADVVGYFRNFPKPFTQINAFTFAPIPPVGTAASTLSSITFTPTRTGTARLTGRGYCNQNGIVGGTNEINLAAGTTEGSAFIDVANWAVMRLPNGSAAGLHQVMWSTDVTLGVTQGAAVTVSLFGRHGSGAIADDCSGTFAVELLL
jgi:hypothetical protein